MKRESTRLPNGYRIYRHTEELSVFLFFLFDFYLGDDEFFYQHQAAPSTTTIPYINIHRRLLGSDTEWEETRRRWIQAQERRRKEWTGPQSTTNTLQ